MRVRPLRECIEILWYRFPSRPYNSRPWFLHLSCIIQYRSWLLISHFFSRFNTKFKSFLGLHMAFRSQLLLWIWIYEPYNNSTHRPKSKFTIWSSRSHLTPWLKFLPWWAINLVCHETPLPGISPQLSPTPNDWKLPHTSNFDQSLAKSYTPSPITGPLSQFQQPPPSMSRY